MLVCFILSYVRPIYEILKELEQSSSETDGWTDRWTHSRKHEMTEIPAGADGGQE